VEPGQGGYPKRMPDGRLALTAGDGKILGYGRKAKCTKIRPGAPGAWISNERCSYNFKLSDKYGSGWYACRGYGEGVAASCRRMKRPRR